MRRSPRRPLILRRRKLPFFQNESTPSDVQDGAPDCKKPSKPAAIQCFPDGIRIMDHPSMCDTQVVVIPKTADLQSVIGALTAKGKECGPQGPNKFILVSEDSGSLSQAAAKRESGSRSATGPPERGGHIHNSPEAKPLTGIKSLMKDANSSRLDDSLTNIQWLGKMSTCGLEPGAAKQMSNEENLIQISETSQAHNMYTNAGSVQQPLMERPPYSYMAMIQFAINSRRNRKMTLKEIYMWIEDNFPYYREVAKPGWKNSIRHNLSLHDMFVREASSDGKIFFWTIRPEANRCLTLDQVYKPGCDSMAAPASGPMLLLPHQQQKRMALEARKTPTSERRIKPLLPRTESYFVPIQLPVASSVYLPTPSASFTPASSMQKPNTSRGAKRVRIAPKETQSNIPAVAASPREDKDLKMEVKQEPTCTPINCETPKAAKKTQASSSRRKQRLVHSLHEEPVLLCPNNTFFDSGLASDASTFQDVRDPELDEQQQMQDSPDREFSFKTPIKSSTHLTSSTPSKLPLNVAVEPWKVTPVGKGTQTVVEVSPIRTPGGPAVTPRHDYTTFSFSSTPFKDLPLFNSPRELLTSAPTRASPPAESPLRHLSGGAPAPANRSVTEGLVLDTMNDSLSKILVDISFSGLDDEDLETGNISWSEFLNQLK